MEPTREEVANAHRALQRAPGEIVGWRRVTTGGHTPAGRWVVSFEGGGSAFVKVAVDELTASWLRDEHVVYSTLKGAPFMPGYLGFSDENDRPVLALEDLSAAAWPPPWDGGRIASLRSCLERMWATPAPRGTTRAVDDAREIAGGWDEIGRSPEPFLALGLCSRSWLAAHLDALKESADGAEFDGDALLHFDVRSDNVCFRADGSAVLVDWNLTAVGNPQIDVVFWLPSLQAEGGPAPERVLPVAHPGLVSTCAAFFCARAARPPIPTAPTVREVQLVQASTALPWAARVLGLAQPS